MSSLYITYPALSALYKFTGIYNNCSRASLLKTYSIVVHLEFVVVRLGKSKRSSRYLRQDVFDRPMIIMAAQCSLEAKYSPQREKRERETERERYTEREGDSEREVDRDRASERERKTGRERQHQ